MNLTIFACTLFVDEVPQRRWVQGEIKTLNYTAFYLYNMMYKCVLHHSNTIYIMRKALNIRIT